MCDIDVNEQSLVNDIIHEFITANRAFTALDVTTEARKRGATTTHSQLQDAVKTSATLRDELQYGDYYTEYPTAQFLLYYPNGYNVDQWIHDQRQPAEEMIDERGAEKADTPVEIQYLVKKAMDPHSTADDIRHDLCQGLGLERVTLEQYLDSVAEKSGTDLSNDSSVCNLGKDEESPPRRRRSRGRVMVRKEALVRLGLEAGQRMLVRADATMRCVLIRPFPKDPQTAFDMGYSGGWHPYMVERDGDWRPSNTVLHKAGITTEWVFIALSNIFDNTLEIRPTVYDPGSIPPDATILKGNDEE